MFAVGRFSKIMLYEMLVDSSSLQKFATRIFFFLDENAIMKYVSLFLYFG